jgi:hypothetical protein
MRGATSENFLKRQRHGEQIAVAPRGAIDLDSHRQSASRQRDRQ